MEKVIVNKQKMYVNVRTVLAKYSQVWAGVLPFKKNVDAFDENLGRLEGKELGQLGSKGAAAGKSQRLSIMLAYALEVCGGGLAYAADIRDKKLAESFKFTKSSLEEGKDKEIYTRCSLIFETAEPIKLKLADYNISNARLTEFRDTIKDYHAFINLPRENRKSVKSSKEEMLLCVEECDRILDEIIDNLMLTFGISHPDFCVEYNNARQIGGWKKKKNEKQHPAA